MWPSDTSIAVETLKWTDVVGEAWTRLRTAMDIEKVLGEWIGPWNLLFQKGRI